MYELVWLASWDAGQTTNLSLKHTTHSSTTASVCDTARHSTAQYSTQHTSTTETTDTFSGLKHQQQARVLEGWMEHRSNGNDARVHPILLHLSLSAPPAQSPPYLCLP